MFPITNIGKINHLFSFISIFFWCEQQQILLLSQCHSINLHTMMQLSVKLPAPCPTCWLEQEEGIPHLASPSTREDEVNVLENFCTVHTTAFSLSFFSSVSLSFIKQSLPHRFFSFADGVFFTRRKPDFTLGSLTLRQKVAL